MKKILKVCILAVSLVVALKADAKHFDNIHLAVDEFIIALEQKDKKVLEALFTKQYQHIVEENEINA